MSDSASATIAAAAKQRLRREAKLRENYDRISASLSIYDSKASKKPTRIIPDVAGFHILSNAEIKRDTKDIEKNSSFSHQKDRNLNEEMDNLIHRSMRPHCPPESNLMKKKRRLMNWINNPDTMEKEVLLWKNNLNNKKNNLKLFHEDKDTWTANAHNVRKFLTDALKLNIENNKILKLNGIQLLQLCELECTNHNNSNNNTTTTTTANNNINLRKKRSFHAKDLVEEIQNRENNIDIAMNEYFELLKEAETYADKIGKSNSSIPLPTTTAYVSVDEVHYIEDSVYIQHKYSTANTATTSTASSNTTTATQHVCVDTTTHDNNEMEMEVNVKNEVSDPIVEEKRECISDIPLPYFDSETKQIIPVEMKEEQACIKETDLVNMVNISNNANSNETKEISRPQTRKRSGSIGSMKLDASKTAAVVLENDTTTAESSESATPDSDPSGHKLSTLNGNWSPSNMSTTATVQQEQCQQGSKVLTDHDLLQLLTAVQENVKISELNIADTEFMFQDRPAAINDATIIHAILQNRRKTPNQSALEIDNKPIVDNHKKNSSQGLKEQRMMIPNKDNEEMKALAVPYLALDRHNEGEWSAYMDNLFNHLDGQGIVTRKTKKKGPEYLPICVDPRLQTPRGVNLLFSPLSQFEGRMLGVYHHDTIFQEVQQAQDSCSDNEKVYTTKVQLPLVLETAEKDSIQRCSIQSAAAIADLHLRRLKTSIKEVNKFVLEAQNSMTKAENVYEVATVEESMELRRMYKEMLHYGLVSAETDDPPLSPITSNSASIATSILQNGVYNNNKPGTKNTRPPVRGTSVSARHTNNVNVPSAAIAIDSTSNSSSDIGGGSTTNASESSSGGKITTVSSEELTAVTAGTVGESETGKRKATATTTVATTAGSSAPKRRR